MSDTATLDRAKLIEALQTKGIDVNPNASTKSLQAKLDKASEEKPKEVEKIIAPKLSETEPSSDMQKLMGMMSIVADKLGTIEKRVTSIETNGKGDFKLSVKASDVEQAAESKKNVDERIVKIVEETLGVDFGVEITPNPNSPGFLFSVLVPERLSEVKRTTRPIPDLETGKYKLDPKTNQVVEEEYWPGDRRSRAVGSADSFDVIRDQCNRVRAYIVTYYEKNKKPLPDFKLK